MTSQHHIDTRRRLSEIKIELQGLMRQKVRTTTNRCVVFQLMPLFV